MTTGADDPVLRVADLCVDFRTSSGWVNVVDSVSFDVRRGESLGVVGESGSGKSVTSLAIMGLIGKPSGRIRSGSIMLEGQELVRAPERKLQKVRGSQIAMIFQEPATSLNPAFTVGDQVAESVRRHMGVNRRESRTRAVEALSSVGIPDAKRRAKAYPHEFSGGMRQRVMIAIAIACEPKVLIADEPTTALDVTIQAQVLELLDDLRTELDMALVLITHDLGVVAEVCDRVQVMYAGQIVERSDIEPLYALPQHPYTSGLLRSMPQVAPRAAKRLTSIPGGPPQPGMMPSGCRFGPRCSMATAACHSQPIDMVDLGSDRASRCMRIPEMADELAIETMTDDEVPS